MIDPMLGHERWIFNAALNDPNETELRRVVGQDGAYCVDRKAREALLVFTAADGSQAAEVYYSDLVARFDIPRSFRAREIRREGAKFVVAAADGRVARGTVRQFVMDVRLIHKQENPAYQDQLAEVFLDTHLLPEYQSTPDAFPPISDPVLGKVAHTGEFGRYEATVQCDGAKLRVWFDAAGLDKVTELLPHAHTLVTEITGLHDKARDMLWLSGGSDSPRHLGEREHFDAVVQPSVLNVYRSGDFEIYFHDDGSFIREGHWLTAIYRADTTPILAYIDC